MSVRVGDRDEGKLQVLEASKNLIRYTYERCVDKTFPKAERWLIPQSIWKEVYSAHSKIVQANKIRVTNKSEAEQRILLSEESLGHLDELMFLIDICHVLGKISDDRAEYWTGLVYKAQDLDVKWIKAQRTDYSEFLTQ